MLNKNQASSERRSGVTLSARQLARDVFIEIPVQGAKCTDNFCDLLPGQTKKVIMTSDKLNKNEKVDITCQKFSVPLHLFIAFRIHYLSSI